MVQRTGGPRRKSRSKLKKNVRAKGKLSIRNYLQKFEVNDSVALVAEPAVQTGMHHRRFQGKIGIVKGKQGNAYKIALKVGKMVKTLIVHPVHMRKH